MARRRKPTGGQTLKTFIKNHARQIFAVDFLTQYTALFTVVYIFVVMEIASRRIVLINATCPYQKPVHGEIIADFQEVRSAPPRHVERPQKPRRSCPLVFQDAA